MDTTVLHTAQWPNSFSSCPMGQGRAWCALHVQLVASLLSQTLLQLTRERPGKPPRPGDGSGLRQGLPAMEKVAVHTVVPVNLVVLLKEHS